MNTKYKLKINNYKYFILIFIINIISTNTLFIQISKSFENEEYISEKHLKYGPIRVDSSQVYFKKGNLIVKSINSQEKDIYIAISCEKNLLNVRSQFKPWKGWLPPKFSFEKKLLEEVCSMNKTKYISLD